MEFSESVGPTVNEAGLKVHSFNCTVLYCAALHSAVLCCAVDYSCPPSSSTQHQCQMPNNRRMPDEERRSAMRAQWGFGCGCSRCAGGSDASKIDMFMAQHVCACGAPLVPTMAGMPGGHQSPPGNAETECTCSDVGHLFSGSNDTN